MAASLAFEVPIGSYFAWGVALGLKETIWSQILPMHLVNPIFVLILREYYRCCVSWETLEAARLDGASERRLFFRMLLPQARPALVTVGFFTALSYWNDWQNAQLFLHKGHTTSKVLEMRDYLIRHVQWENCVELSHPSPIAHTGHMAAMVLYLIPVVLLYLLVRRHLIRGARLGKPQQ